MTGVTPSDDAARRARREWRRKRRENGRRLILASYAVIGIAVVVGALGLLSSGDDGDDSVTSGQDGNATERRGVGLDTNDEDDDRVVIDLVPSTTRVGGDGGTPAVGSSDQIVSGDSFGVRTVFGIIQVRAAPVGDRPNPNQAPTVRAPSSVDRDEQGESVISGITIQDRDYPGVGDIGVLLILDGTATVVLNQDVQLLAPNSNAFVALAGPPEALNRALADLRVHTDSATELVILVTDWGYGDLPRAQSASATVAIG